MSVKITTRTSGEVVIIDFSGKITLGEGSEAFRDTIADLVAARKMNILLNLTDVSYMDSSGIGGLVSSFTSVSRQGGKLKLVHLTKKIHALLQNTKLYTVFEIFHDEAVALRSFSAPVRTFACPVCGGQVRLPAIGADSWGDRYCTSCEAHILLEESAEGGSEALIRSIRIGSYWGEHVEVSAGPPFRLRVVGRMNLFSSSALKKAWCVIPKPRRVLVDLAAVTDIEAAGCDVLAALIAGEGNDPRIAISLAGLTRELRSRFPAAPPFFEDEATALRALGELSGTPRLLVRIDVAG